MRRWDTKPPLGSVIDRSHPIGGHLVAAWLFNERHGTTCDSLGGYYPGTLEGGFTWDDEGVRSDGNANSVVDFQYDAAALIIGQAKSTVVLGLSLEETPAAIDGIVSAAQNAPSPFTLRFDASQRLTWYDSAETITGSTSFASGGHMVVVASMGLGQQALYVNGVREATGTANTPTDNGDELYLGTDHSKTGTRKTKALYRFLYIFSEALLWEHAIELTVDPYCLIKAPARKIYVSVPAAAGNPWYHYAQQ